MWGVTHRPNVWDLQPCGLEAGTAAPPWVSRRGRTGQGAWAAAEGHRAAQARVRLGLLDAHAALCRPLDLGASDPAHAERRAIAPQGRGDPSADASLGSGASASGPAWDGAHGTASAPRPGGAVAPEPPTRHSSLVPAGDNASADVTRPVHPARRGAAARRGDALARSCAPGHQREPAVAARGGAAPRGAAPASQALTARGHGCLERGRGWDSGQGAATVPWKPPSGNVELGEPSLWNKRELRSHARDSGHSGGWRRARSLGRKPWGVPPPPPVSRRTPLRRVSHDLRAIPEATSA